MSEAQTHSIANSTAPAAATPVEKKIAAVRNKMIGTVALILGLGIWQQHFVLEGIAAHMEITLTILATFAFSIVLAFIFVAKLKNEIIAFKALREMWDDIQHAPLHQSRDPLWRHYRCIRPAQVFQRPRLLGHAYELVTEELARSKRMRVSVETMNTLVHTVESTINDEKSLITYLSGLLVFMGLIGTFIGLLHMVGSIGGIIGSLAGSAGGAAAQSAFGELLAALQEPLKGMASGFAASLFGLFSSLVVGLLGRFAGQAAGVLKGEFEAWLAGVVQIGEEEDETALHGSPARGAGALGDPALLRMVGGILTDYAKVAGQFDDVTRNVQALNANQTRQIEAIHGLVAHLDRMEAGQRALLTQLDQRPSLHPSGDLDGVLEEFGNRITERLGADSQLLRETVAEMSRQHAANIRLLTSSQHQTAGRLSEAIEMISAEIDRRAEHSPLLGLESAIGRATARTLDDLDRKQAGQMREIESALARLAESQQKMTEALAQEGRPLSSPAAAPVDHQGIERALSDGFVRISQSMESAFSAYSGLVHVALAAVERANPPATQEVPQGRKAETKSELQHMLDAMHRQGAAPRSA